MKLPDNTELFETPISTHWFDEDGILCGISKNVERKIENYVEVMNLYKRLTKDGNKVCVLADASNGMPLNKEMRDYLTTETPKYIKAQAVVSKAPLQQSQSNTFLNLSWQGFPVRLFSNAEDAKRWLMEYL